MAELAMLADIQRTVYPEEVTHQLHVMTEARESIPGSAADLTLGNENGKTTLLFCSSPNSKIGSPLQNYWVGQILMQMKGIRNEEKMFPPQHTSEPREDFNAF